MNTPKSVEAQQVKPNERVYDSHYYAPDKWVRVHSVETKGTATYINLGHSCIVLHPRQGIAVMPPLDAS